MGKHNFPAVLAENLWVLGNYYFNLYLVQGNNASALIEVGISAITDTVISQLDSLNISPDYLVVPHPHTDHITGLQGLRQRFPDAIPIFGQGAQEFVSHPKALGAMISEDQFMAQMLSVKGIRPERPPIENFYFPDDHIVAKDEYAVDLGGIVLNCMQAKGHSPGNIIVHIPDRRALILSDSLGFHFPDRCFLPLFFTGFSDYMKTLDCMEALNPRIIGLGHQGPLIDTDAERAFYNSRQATLNLYSTIIGRQKDKDDIADEIFNTYYKDEFTIYSEKNIRNCARLLVRRALELADRNEGNL